MDTTGITCSDCGSAIDHLSQGDPCPSCGGTKRTIAVEAHSTITVSSELTEAVVDRAWPRPWSDRWNAVGIALGRLRRAYGQDRIEGDEVRLAIKDFFVESTHMYDALKTDSSTGLSGTQIYK